MFQRTVAVLLAIIALMISSCSGNLLDAQRAKDRDLAEMAGTNMATSATFMANYVSLEFAEEPGKYICVTKDLTDAQAAGRFAYNAMVVLDERNNTKVKTGRSSFVIIGQQDGTEIFEVTFGVGQTRPTVTLKGPFEGETYTPGAG
jgi:hypothetical protein